MTSHVYIIGEIGMFGVSLQSVKDQLDPMSTDIAVHIYSPGGEVYEGYAIYNELKNQNKPITVYIEGLCASIASVIAMAGSNVIINPMSQFMIHNPSGGVYGDAEEMRHYAEQLDAIKGQLIQAYQTRTTLSEKELWKMLDNETWLTSEEAVQMGFADEVGQTLKAVAYFKKDMKPEEKNDFLDKIEGMFNKIENSIKDAIKPKANAEEEKKVEEVDVDAIKAENEALKNQLAEANQKLTETSTKVETVEAQNVELSTKFDEVKGELTDLKNMIKAKDAPAATGAASNRPSNSAFDQLAENAKNLFK